MSITDLQTNVQSVSGIVGRHSDTHKCAHRSMKSSESNGPQDLATLKTARISTLVSRPLLLPNLVAFLLCSFITLVGWRGELHSKWRHGMGESRRYQFTKFYIFRVFTEGFYHTRQSPLTNGPRSEFYESHQLRVSCGGKSRIRLSIYTLRYCPITHRSWLGLSIGSAIRLTAVRML